MATELFPAVLRHGMPSPKFSSLGDAYLCRQCRKTSEAEFGAIGNRAQSKVEGKGAGRIKPGTRATGLFDPEGTRRQLQTLHLDPRSTIDFAIFITAHDSQNQEIHLAKFDYLELAARWIRKRFAGSVVLEDRCRDAP